MEVWKSSRAIKDDEQFKRDVIQFGVMKVAKMMNISPQTVKVHCKRLGIPSVYGNGTNYVICGDTAVFTTRKGQAFKVDAADAEEVGKLTWYIANTGYVTCDKSKSKNDRFLLHRFLLNPEDGYVVDHINHDKTDNKRSNLRKATVNQNQMNRSFDSRNKSGITGVIWFKANEKWMAFISVNKKRIHLGYFETKEEAAKARKDAENKYFKEFAVSKNVER